MKRLIAIELQKIWKNRASKVLTITYFVLLTFIALFAAIKFDIGPFKLHLADEGIFNFPYIWHFNTYFASWLKIFLALIIVSMMANEYSYGTLKQNLIDGMSKKEFVLSKFLTVVLFAGISTVFIFIVSLVLGLIYSSYTEIGIIFSDLEYLLAYFIKLVGFFSFCLFLGILIKRSAFAIGFLFIWFLVEKISYGVLKYEIFNKNPVIDDIYAFMPLESISNLIVEPITRLSVVRSMGSQLGVNSIGDYSIHWYSLLIVIIWTAIFVFLSYKLLKKRDL